MNGAQALIRTLVACGVDTCFMNPGTSEMHFVAALDAVPEMHSVLALFEGVATGAADGYGRMADRPAATLLHLGPGLGNGLANLHNARKGQTPVVNIVGDHATYHKQYDAQLESDIETVARNVSSFIRWSAKTDEVGSDAADTVAAAFGPPGQVATLVLPADISWSEGGEAAAPKAPRPRATRRRRARFARSPTRCAPASRRCCSSAAPRAANRRWRSPARSPTRPAPSCCARRSRPGSSGAPGGSPVDRIAYLAEFAAMQLDGARHLVLVDAKAPVSFFAYPEKASWLSPDGCEVHTLAGPADDALAALAGARRRAGRDRSAAARQPLARPELPTGPLTAQAVCAALGALLPEGAIVSDEGNTSGLFAAGATAGAPPHDWLCLTGGAIGQGLPVAVGAAVACPRPAGRSRSSPTAARCTRCSRGGRWPARASTSRRSLFNNGSYAVLNMELDRVGAEGAGRGPRRCSTSAGPTSTSSRWPTGMGVTRDARDHRRGVQRPARARSRRRARRSSRRSCRRSSDDAASGDAGQPAPPHHGTGQPSCAATPTTFPCGSLNRPNVTPGTLVAGCTMLAPRFTARSSAACTSSTPANTVTIAAPLRRTDPSRNRARWNPTVDIRVARDSPGGNDQPNSSP